MEGAAVGDGVVGGLAFGGRRVVGVVLAVLGRAVAVLWWGTHSREGRRTRSLGKARGVGGGLRAELSEVEIRTSAVTQIHGLVKAAFGIEAIEDDSVDGNGDRLNDDLNEGTDE